VRTEVDVDFAAWVGARERTLLRAAYVIRGDRREAERIVVGVLAAMAARWDRIRLDDPDSEARRLLFRDAVARHPHHRDPDADDPERVPDEWLDAGSDTARALRQISARQRAICVLRGLEGRSAREAADVLGIGTGSVESQTASAVARIGDALPSVDGLVGVASFLDRATDHLPDADLADRAWEAAARRGQRRRRSVVVTTAAALLLGSVVTYAGSRGSTGDAVPDKVSQVTVGPSTEPSATALADDGTQLFFGPSPDVIANLPIASAGIPGQVDWDPRAAPQPLAQVIAAHAGPSGRANLRILYAVLSPGSVGGWVPVLLLRDDRDGGLSYAAVDTRLGALGTAFGEPATPLTARAVDPSGTTAMFLQKDSVIVVDVVTGSTRTVPLPAGIHGVPSPLGDAGFSDLGRVIVRDGYVSWSLDPVTLTWSHLADGSSPEAVDAAEVSASSLPMQENWGETVVTRDWVATGGVVDRAAVPARFRVDNALFLVSRTDPRLRRALVLGANAAGAIPGAIRTVGVAGSAVLFQYSVAGRTWVLGLDPTTGLVSRVAEVWAPVGGVGSAGQVIAVSSWALAHR